MGLNADCLASTPPATAVGVTVRLPTGVVVTTSDAGPTFSILTRTSLNGAAQTILTSLATRLGWMLYNDSTTTLRVHYGVGASAIAFIVLMNAGDLWVDPFRYTGDVSVIATAATGNVQAVSLG